MRKRTIAGMSIVGVVVYIALVAGIRVVLSSDSSGSWLSAIVGATGVVTALLTAVLVGVTALYVQLTGKIVELEASGPARQAEQTAMREFLNIFVVAENACLDMQRAGIGGEVYEGRASSPVKELFATFDKANEVGLEAIEQLYRIAHQLPSSQVDDVLDGAKLMNAANRQINMLRQAVLGVSPDADPKGEITFEAIQAYYDAKVRAGFASKDERQEWEDVRTVSKADAAMKVLRDARLAVMKALNLAGR